MTDVTVIWAGGRTEPPLDKPRCGWENELCLEQERQGKFLGKMCNKVVFIVYFLGCILCIFVGVGLRRFDNVLPLNIVFTEAVVKRLTRFHLI